MDRRSIKEFNDEVRLAIDNAVRNLLGQRVLESLYRVLHDRCDITANEIPYRIEAVFDTLESVLGYDGARTISRVIARRIYSRMGLRFIEVPHYRLEDYVESAKRQLPQSNEKPSKTLQEHENPLRHRSNRTRTK